VLVVSGFANEIVGLLQYEKYGHAFAPSREQHLIFSKVLNRAPLELKVLRTEESILLQWLLEMSNVVTRYSNITEML